MGGGVEGVRFVERSDHSAVLAVELVLREAEEQKEEEKGEKRAESHVYDVLEMERGDWGNAKGFLLLEEFLDDVDAAKQKRHGFEKGPHELDFGLRDRLLVRKNRVEHIDVGALEDLLLVGHDLFERFGSLSPPCKPPNEIPSTPLHRLMISVISVELTGICSEAKNCWGSMRREGRTDRSFSPRTPFRSTSITQK